MGVIGAPLYPSDAIMGTHMYLRRLSTVKGKLIGSQCSHYRESPYKAGPIRIFKFVRSLPAGTEDPKIQVVDNLPRYGG